jgi:hypothetical protein
MQWYVDNVLGKGYDKELFYSEPSVINAYRGYVEKIITRKNTLTGLPYKDDPTILGCTFLSLLLASCTLRVHLLHAELLSVKVTL